GDMIAVTAHGGDSDTQYDARGNILYDVFGGTVGANTCPGDFQGNCILVKASDNSLIQNITGTDNMACTAAFQNCSNCTISNCTARLTQPQQTYIQWQIATYNTTNCTIADCTYNSDYMQNGIAIAFGSVGTQLLRSHIRNGSINCNNGGNFLIKD